MRSRSITEIWSAIQAITEMFDCPVIDEAAARRELEALDPTLVEALALLASFAPLGGEL